MYARMASGLFLALGFADLAVLNFILAPRLAAGEAQRATTLGAEAAPSARLLRGPEGAVESAASGAPASAAPRPVAPAAPAALPSPPPPPAATAASPVDAAPDIVFGLDEIRFTSLAAGKDLQRLAAELRADARKKLILRGHSDRLGSPAHNLILSGQRAEVVARILAVNGAPLERVTVEAVGDNEPADTSDTPLGWMRNRRVQLLWR
jgi:outer membrane protein OmpA-like peptidoglycan-associated protein